MICQHSDNKENILSNKRNVTSFEDPLYRSEEDNPLNQNSQNSSAYNKVIFCHAPLFRGLSSRRYGGSYN